MKNFPGGMQNFLRQAQQMQNKMSKLQEELAQKTLEVSAGGGMITVKVTGSQKLEAIQINPEVVKAGDVDMLQDMVCAAVNEAIQKSKEMSEQEMQKITGGMSIPGLF